MRELVFAVVVVVTVALWIIEAKKNRIALVMDVAITTIMTTYVTFGYSMLAGIMVMVLSDVISIMILSKTDTLNKDYDSPGLAGGILINVVLLVKWVFKGFFKVIKLTIHRK